MFRFLAPGLLVLAAVAVTAADDAPPLKVTTRRADDRADVKFEESKATVSVRSPSGISRAVVERAGGAWPDAVILRLHLKGLENFSVATGKVTLEGSVSVRDGKAVVRLWKDGKEDAPLDATSPYRTEVRVVDDDGKPAKENPLKGGYFELFLPGALFEGNPKTITVNWIDFYRN